MKEFEGRKEGNETKERRKYDKKEGGGRKEERKEK